MLAAIEERCAANQWSEALDLALGIWRRTKAPAYGDLVEAISSKTKAPPIPIVMGRGVFHSRWLERAAVATESDVVPLLATFGAELSTTRPRAGWDTTAAARRVRAALAIENAVLGDHDAGAFMAISARLEALAALGPDPRVAKTLLAFVRNRPVLADGAIRIATYGPVLDLLAEIGDVRLIPALERLLSEPFLERPISRLLTMLRRTPIDVPPDAHGAAALAHRLGFRGEAPANERNAGPDVAELFELVVHALDDDAPRLVLADRWLELGDPRGELVTLQLKGAVSAEILEKIRAIVWHDRDWLGELALVTRARVYVRGFLDEFELPPEAAATPERWALATKNPNLGTVRRMRCGAGNELHYRAFLFSSAMRNLEDVEIPSAPLLREVLEAPSLGRLRRLTLLRSFASNAVRDAVTAMTARPEIERVTVHEGSSTHLLPLATERTSVAVTERGAMVVATRTKEGLHLRGDDAERIARNIRKSRRGESVRIVPAKNPG